MVQIYYIGNYLNLKIIKSVVVGIKIILCITVATSWDMIAEKSVMMNDKWSKIRTIIIVKTSGDLH